ADLAEADGVAPRNGEIRPVSPCQLCGQSRRREIWQDRKPHVPSYRSGLMDLHITPIHGWGWADQAGQHPNVPPQFELEATVLLPGDPPSTEQCRYAPDAFSGDIHNAPFDLRNHGC